MVQPGSRLTPVNDVREVWRAACSTVSTMNGLVLIAVVGLATGCAVAPEPETSSAELAIGSGSAEPPDPPEDPPVCVRDHCTKVLVGGYVTTAQQQLGCSQSYQYQPNGPGSFQGGYASYCPNTPTVLTYLRNHNLRGFGPGYCSHCMLAVPANKVFVFWLENIGPGCPGGCEPVPYPPNF